MNGILGLLNSPSLAYGQGTQTTVEFRGFHFASCQAVAPAAAWQGLYRGYFFVGVALANSGGII